MLRETLQKPCLLHSHSTQSAPSSSSSPATLTSNKRYGLYPISVSLQMRKCVGCCVLRDAYGLPDVSPTPWYRRGEDISRPSMGTAVQIQSCRYRRLDDTVRCGTICQPNISTAYTVVSSPQRYLTAHQSQEQKMHGKECGQVLSRRR